MSDQNWCQNHGQGAQSPYKSKHVIPRAVNFWLNRFLLFQFGCIDTIDGSGSSWDNIGLFCGCEEMWHQTECSERTWWGRGREGRDRRMSQSCKTQGHWRSQHFGYTVSKSDIHLLFSAHISPNSGFSLVKIANLVNTWESSSYK